LVDNKNDSNFKTIMLENDRDLILPYIERLEAIQVYKKDFVENKNPPKRICSDEHCKRAKDCNMRDACFNIGEGRKKLKKS